VTLKQSPWLMEIGGPLSNPLASKTSFFSLLENRMPSWREKVYQAVGQTPPPLPKVVPVMTEIPETEVERRYREAAQGIANRIANQRSKDPRIAAEQQTVDSSSAFTEESVSLSKKKLLFYAMLGSMLPGADTVAQFQKENPSEKA
jgi:hypothetical protein